jgi:hypothetical protein
LLDTVQSSAVSRRVHGGLIQIAEPYILIGAKRDDSDRQSALRTHSGGERERHLSLTIQSG